MHNSINVLHILHAFEISGKYAKVPKIVPVIWQAPKPSWIKLNNDGVANRCPGVAGG